jgi:hypothetical protein
MSYVHELTTPFTEAANVHRGDTYIFQITLGDGEDGQPESFTAWDIEQDSIVYKIVDKAGTVLVDLTEADGEVERLPDGDLKITLDGTITGGIAAGKHEHALRITRDVSGEAITIFTGPYCSLKSIL